MLVRTAYENHVVSFQPVVAGNNIRRENRPYQSAQVGRKINVRPRAGDHDFAEWTAPPDYSQAFTIHEYLNATEHERKGGAGFSLLLFLPSDPCWSPPRQKNSRSDYNGANYCQYCHQCQKRHDVVQRPLKIQNLGFNNIDVRILG